MKILFSVPRYHPNHDGMVQGLLEAGHEVCFLIESSHPTERHLNGVRVIRVPGHSTETPVEGWTEPAFHRRASAPAPLRFLNRLLAEEKPGLVIGRNASVLNSWFYILCRFHRVRFLLYVLSPSGYEQLIWQRRLLLRLGLWPPHTINTVCQAPADPVPRKTFDFIPFAIDARHYRKIDYPSTPPLRVLAIGKLDQRRKNNIPLVRCLAPYLRDGRISLTIAGLLGSDPGPAWPELLEEIETQGVAQAVHLLQNLAFEEARRLPEDHDLFIMPSSREPAGIAPVEAMATGLAVITGSDAGTKYFVEPGETGFIFPDKDFDELARRVEWCITHPGDLERMGRKGRQIIEERYSPAKFEERLMAIVARRFGGVPA